jgi:hypothetical protein
VNADRFWLCWSPHQNAYHIDDEASCLAFNQGAHARRAKPHFLPLAIFDSRQEASAVVGRLIEERNRRAKTRTFSLEHLVRSGAWVFLDLDVPRLVRQWDSNLPDRESGERFVGGLRPVGFFADESDAARFCHEFQSRIEPERLRPQGDVLDLKSVFSVGAWIVRESSSGDLRETSVRPADLETVVAWLALAEFAPLTIQLIEEREAGSEADNAEAVE